MIKTLICKYLVNQNTSNYKNMKLAVESIIQIILRSYLKPFTMKDVMWYIHELGFKNVHKKEIEKFITTNSLVFPLENKRYITKAGSFTNYFFCISPTTREIENKIFIAGSRCLPFVDADMISSSLSFYYNGKKLPKKIIKWKSFEAEDFFSMYGKEFASQYVAADPANANINIIDENFMLPEYINLTAFSLDPLIDQQDFHRGCRLVCSIKNWDKGEIDICKVTNESLYKTNVVKFDTKKVAWCKRLETELLRSFNIIGPCSSIDEQLAYVFFNNRENLCNFSCYSLSDFFEYTKKIDFEDFGVETRLWFSGQSIPAFGKWNSLKKINSTIETTKQKLIIEPFIFDAYIKDSLFYSESNIEKICNRILLNFPKVRSEWRKSLLLQIENRNAILLKEYNWFADYDVGILRHQLLFLYDKLVCLITELDCYDEELESFPQQDLVVLSQIYNNVIQILSEMEIDSYTFSNNYKGFVATLNGMKESFIEIEENLTAAVIKEKKRTFKIIS